MNNDSMDIEQNQQQQKDQDSMQVDTPMQSHQNGHHTVIAAHSRDSSSSPLTEVSVGLDEEGDNADQKAAFDNNQATSGNGVSSASLSTLNGEHAGNGSISSNAPAKRKSRTITLKKKLRDSSSSLRQSGSLVDYAEGDEEDDDDDEEDQDIDDYGDYAEGYENEFGEDAYDQQPLEQQEERSKATKAPANKKRKRMSKAGSVGSSKKKASSSANSRKSTSNTNDVNSGIVPFPDQIVELDRIIYRKFLPSTLDGEGDQDGHSNGSSSKEMFLVKFVGRSYLHCEWVDEEWILNDKRGRVKLKNFMERTIYDVGYQLLNEDRPYSEDWTKIDRILDANYAQDPFGQTMHNWYLVKWTGLPYDAATWESEDVLMHECDDADEKIQDYEHRSMVPHQRDVSFYDNCLPFGVRAPVKDWKPLTESPQFLNGNTLRSYQVEGVNWLLYCWHHGQSCIVADQMGLGKTPTSVSFLDRLYNTYGVKGPFLVVAPLSTIPHWQRTFEQWSNMNCVVFHGSAQARSICQNYEFYYTDAQGKRIKAVYPPDSKYTPAIAAKAFNQHKFDVLVTTFEMAMSNASLLRNVGTWRVMVVDEAHRLKNKSSKMAEVLRSYTVEHKLLLTGTPIQNSLEELWAILNFMDPVKFPDNSEKSFLTQYDLKSANDVQRLQALLKPLMLRRLKEDVDSSIPVKEETIIEVEQTDIQRAYYKAILEKNFLFLKDGTKSKNMPSLINTMLELRKCCIHPFLLTGAEEKIVGQYVQQYDPSVTISAAQHHDDYMSALLKSSGKMVLLDKLLPKLRDGKHRVLIFSQMTKCLDIISDYLAYKGYKYERIDGSIRGDLRQAAIDRYSAPDSDIFAFLLSTRAGGVGINLTAADTCIIFDSDWNPQNDLQAQARCHRIGQTKNVKIYRLITRNTYEQTMFQKAGMKLGIDKAVLSKIDVDSGFGEFSSSTGGVSSLSKAEIEDLLKKGAYGAIADEDEEELKKFYEEDIDQILSRRTQVILHDGTEQQKVKGNSLFSKATFQLDDNQAEQLDVNDPEFWDKWAKKANVDADKLFQEQEAEKLAQIIVDEPRKRKKARDSVAGTADDDETMGQQSDNEFADDTSTAEASKIKSQGVPIWTTADRNRIERCLMLYGFGAWEKKMEMFPKKTMNEVKAAEIRLLEWCLEKVQVDLMKSAGRFSKDDQRLFEDVMRAIKSNKWDVPSNEQVAEMAENSCEHRLEPNNEELPVDETYGRYPWPGATKEDLMTHHTFIDSCPESYYVHLDKKPRNILIRTQTMHLLRQDVFDIDTFAVGDVFVHASSASNGDQSSESVNYMNMINKYEILFQKRKENKIFQPQWEEYFGKDEIRQGWETWTEEHDRDLMLATLKYGYAQYDKIRSDPMFVFSRDIESARQANVELPFPSLTDVGTRFRRVTAFCNKYYRKREGATSTEFTQKSLADADASQASIELLSGIDNDLVWSKKAKSDFLNVLNQLGIEEDYEVEMPLEEAEKAPWRIIRKGDETATVLKRDWTQFKKEAELTGKSDESVEIALHLFYRTAEETLADKFPDEVMVDGQRVWPRDLRPNEDVSLRDDPSVRLNIYESNGKVLDMSEGVAQERMRRLIRRIILMHTIRGKILTLPDLDQVLLKAKFSSGLPKWWEVGVHDRALLEGVVKHGFTPLKQNIILFDQDLPFRKICEEELEKKGLLEQLPRLQQLNTLSKNELKDLEGKPVDNAAEEQQILGGQNLESFMGWPKDLIRTRRIEILVMLVMKEFDKSSKTSMPFNRENRRKYEILHMSSSASNMSPSGKYAGAVEDLNDLDYIKDETVLQAINLLRDEINSLKAKWEESNSRASQLIDLLQQSQQSQQQQQEQQDDKE
ncbi:hypothetical protein MP228_002674 [Amoeboaphelidium protococcarum]|nr:hypothetical protein MP228_002674 [Amoeboaphelidium protococcarum]